MKQLFLLLSLLIVIPACVKPIKRKKLYTIKLGMSQSQLTRFLGEPKLFRGSIINKDGQIVEVYEYDIDTGKSTSQIWSEIGYGFLMAFCQVFVYAPQRNDHIKPFWFYFYNNRLVKWGAAGDWQMETHYIYQTNFA